MIEEIKKFMKIYVDEFDELTSDLPKYYGGISRSEAFAFCSLGKFFNVDMVIESGTGKGISGEYFARIFDHVYTIDKHTHYQKLYIDGVNYKDSEKLAKDRLSIYDNITFIRGDSFNHISKLIEKNQRYGVFFDGPKGANAYKLFKRIKVVYAGFHDTGPIKFRNLVDEEEYLFNTHDDWFSEYNKLNENRLQMKGFPNGPGASFLKGGI